MIEQLEDSLNDTTNLLTVERVRDKLQIKYQRLMKEKKMNKNEETALTSSTVTNQFKGRCCVCSKFGHKGADCRVKEIGLENKQKWQS